MNPKIREMTSSDIEAVQETATASWHAVYEGIIPLDIQNRFLDLAYSTDMMHHKLTQSHMFAAEEDGRVIGFAEFTPPDADGKTMLNAIYLHPDAQNKGIGTLLLEHGVEQIEDMTTIYVEVEKENMIGRRFYDTKGFRMVKEYDDDFDGHILKTVLMSRDI
ncbi:GNAT family N-acetyltransferase [Salinicoccus siamensis]|uniref:GNAT family N-acetyltransferase n=1 Tax=Salinicoccus siamensis TaxID=381830 RepID=A0ABV5Z1X5_9STAP